MKKWIGILILLLRSVTSYSQDVQKLDINDVAYAKCVYQLRCYPDSIDLSRERIENVVLLIGRKFSVFQSQNYANMDSIIQHNISTKTIGSTSAMRSSSFFWERIYKNTTKTNITTIARIGLKEFAYAENITDFKWKNSSEKMNIKGYICQKATTSYGGREWNAWYTTELPISEGPYKFSGLPGIIIAISDSRGHYNYELIGLSLNKSVPIHFNNTKTPYTTRKEFRKNLRNFYKNYVDMQLAQGKSVYGDPESARKRVAENNKRRSNTLEIE